MSSLLALQRHATLLRRHIGPEHVGGVQRTLELLGVPESTSAGPGGVFVSNLVVVSVKCAEQHAVELAECILDTVGCAVEPAHSQLVVGPLGPHSEISVPGVEPLSSISLELDLQLVAAILCQAMEPMVADPVVATFFAKTIIVILPLTQEETGFTVVLLDQHGVTVAYRT